LLSYLSYLFRLRSLSEDSYLLERLQSADKTITHPKAKLQNAPTFIGNGSHSHVCLLLEKNLCIYQLCKQQSADTNVLIGRYRLSAHLYHLPQQLICNILASNCIYTHLPIISLLSFIITVIVLYVVTCYIP